MHPLTSPLGFPVELSILTCPGVSSLFCKFAPPGAFCFYQGSSIYPASHSGLPLSLTPAPSLSLTLLALPSTHSQNPLSSHHLHPSSLRPLRSAWLQSPHPSPSFQPFPYGRPSVRQQSHPSQINVGSCHFSSPISLRLQLKTFQGHQAV
jgi:hypothetical protein